MAARPHRRDFISLANCAFIGVGVASSCWPLMAHMNPHRGTPAREAVDVDLTSVRFGQTINVSWRGKPISIRHRTPAEVELMRNVDMRDVRDPFARNEALSETAPASDANRTQEGHENWVAVVSVCTHMGCLLRPAHCSEVAAGEGWICPCHAARFDLSGRVRAGPALTNLPVPPYRFLTPTRIRVG